MQTFKLSLQIDVTAVIMQQFLEEARAETKKPDASLFLKTMQEQFPEDDDQFMLAIVKNALRTTVKHQTCDFLVRSGVGGRVSPVKILSESITQPKALVGEFAEASANGAIPPKEPKAEPLRIEHDKPEVLLVG